MMVVTGLKLTVKCELCGYNAEYSWENCDLQSIHKICEMFSVKILSVVNNTCTRDFVVR